MSLRRSTSRRYDPRPVRNRTYQYTDPGILPRAREGCLTDGVATRPLIEFHADRGLYQRHCDSVSQAPLASAREDPWIRVLIGPVPQGPWVVASRRGSPQGHSEVPD